MVEGGIFVDFLLICDIIVVIANYREWGTKMANVLYSYKNGEEYATALLEIMNRMAHYMMRKGLVSDLMGENTSPESQEMLARYYDGDINVLKRVLARDTCYTADSGEVIPGRIERAWMMLEEPAVRIGAEYSVKSKLIFQGMYLEVKPQFISSRDWKNPNPQAFRSSCRGKAKRMLDNFQQKKYPRRLYTIDDFVSKVDGLLIGEQGTLFSP